MNEEPKFIMSNIGVRFARSSPALSGQTSSHPITTRTKTLCALTNEHHNHGVLSLTVRRSTHVNGADLALAQQHLKNTGVAAICFKNVAIDLRGRVRASNGSEHTVRAIV